MSGAAWLAPEITTDEIAPKAGKRMEGLVVSKDRYSVTEVMSQGAQRKVVEPISWDRIDGIVALGGATVALLASQVMGKLLFGMPKVIGTSGAMPAYS